MTFVHGKNWGNRSQQNTEIDYETKVNDDSEVESKRWTLWKTQAPSGVTFLRM